MGVAGSGKTTVGRELATRLGAPFVDADDAHPPANVAKMAAGVPLDDDDRRPWLDRLAAELGGQEALVVACSALKRSYRDHLRRVDGVRFVFLDLGPDEARDRVANRSGHFMGAEMIESQFAALQRPGPDERDVTTVDATADPASLVDRILAGCSG